MAKKKKAGTELTKVATTKHFQRRLKRERVAKGLTQAQLAEKLSVTQGTVSRWETGHKTPSIPHFKALAKALKIDAYYLLTGKK